MAPMRFEAKAMSAVFVSRNEYVNTRFAMNTGVNASVAASV